MERKKSKKNNIVSKGNKRGSKSNNKGSNINKNNKIDSHIPVCIQLPVIIDLFGTNNILVYFLNFLDNGLKTEKYKIDAILGLTDFIRKSSSRKGTINKKNANNILSYRKLKPESAGRGSVHWRANWLHIDGVKTDNVEADSTWSNMKLQITGTHNFCQSFAAYLLVTNTIPISRSQEDITIENNTFCQDINFKKLNNDVDFDSASHNIKSIAIMWGYFLEAFLDIWDKKSWEEVYGKGELYQDINIFKHEILQNLSTVLYELGYEALDNNELNDKEIEYLNTANEDIHQGKNYDKYLNDLIHILEKISTDNNLAKQIAINKGEANF